MKRSILLAWFVMIMIFAMGIAGIPKSDLPFAQGKEPIPPAPGVADSAVVLCAQINGTPVEMTMDVYLQGVLSAEMPASFSMEALKAQAVAARTETMYKMENGPSSKHPQADICSDINCCQAYLSAEEAKAAWGENAEQYAAKIAEAVRQTDGKVILYGQEPILAAFFSAASGQTNASGDVWLQDLPYLQSVKSPEGENDVPNYHSIETVPKEQFRERFLQEYPQANLEGSPKDWIGRIDRNGSDMVTAIEIGGVSVKGTQVRTLFSLRSASFTVSTDEDAVTFHVTGYGHGVGMSQHGANILALQGKTYEEILCWYYTGVNIGTYTPKNLANEA